MNIASIGTSLKCIVLIEVRPLSDEFENIMLTSEQNRQVTKLVQSFMPKCHKDENNFHCITDSRFAVKIPDVLDQYPDADVAEARGKITGECL